MSAIRKIPIHTYKAIQTIYNITERIKPQGIEIRPIDLNYECDRAYLICILKRDIRKHNSCSEREQQVLRADDLIATFQEATLFNDTLFTLYSDKLKEGFNYNPITKQIINNLKE